MAIITTIEVEDKVSAAVKKAGASVDALTDSFGDVNAAAVKTATIGAKATIKVADAAIEAGKAALKEASSIEEVAAAHATVVDAVNKRIAAQRKLDSATSRASNASAKANKTGNKQLDALGKKFPKLTKGAKGLGRAMKFIAVATVIGIAVQKTAEWAAEITKTRRGWKNTIDVITKGDGERVFAGLTKLAKGLGLKVEDVAASFAKFSKAGVGEKASVQLLKLEADLNSLNLQTGITEEAMGKALDRIKGGEDASKVIAEIGKEMGVVGDGSKAAAVKIGTLDGKMDALGSTWDEVKVAIAEPVADFMLWAIDGLSSVGSSLAETNAELNVFFGGLTASVQTSVAEFASWAGGVATSVGEAVSGMASKVSDFFAKGAEFVSGLLKGALSIDFVGGLVDMAAGALSAVKATLGIASPSKVFAEVGMNVGRGFTRGVEATPAPALPMPALPMAAGASGGASGGDVTINFEITGGDAAGIAREVRREIAQFFNQRAMSGG